MNSQKFITRVALDDLLENLGLNDMNEEFKTKISEDILNKFHDLISVKLKDLLGAQKFQQLVNLDEQSQEAFLLENNIKIQEVMEFTANFLREHLEDYSQGIEEFLSDQKK